MAPHTAYTSSEQSSRYVCQIAKGQYGAVAASARKQSREDDDQKGRLAREIAGVKVVSEQLAEAQYELPRQRDWNNDLVREKARLSDQVEQMLAAAENTTSSQQEVGTLRRQVQDLAAENTALKVETAEASSVAQTLMRKEQGLRAAQRDVRTREETIARLEQELETLRKQVEDLGHGNSSLRADAAAETSAATTAAGTTAAGPATPAAGLDLATTPAEGVGSDVSQLQAELQQARDELQEVRTSRDTALVNLAAADMDITILTMQVGSQPQTQDPQQAYQTQGSEEISRVHPSSDIWQMRDQDAMAYPIDDEAWMEGVPPDYQDAINTFDFEHAFPEFALQQPPFGDSAVWNPTLGEPHAELSAFDGSTFEPPTEDIDFATWLNQSGSEPEIEPAVMSQGSVDDMDIDHFHSQDDLHFLPLHRMDAVRIDQAQPMDAVEALTIALEQNLELTFPTNSAHHPDVEMSSDEDESGQASLPAPAPAPVHSPEVVAPQSRRDTAMDSPSVVYPTQSAGSIVQSIETPDAELATPVLASPSDMTMTSPSVPSTSPHVPSTTSPTLLSTAIVNTTSAGLVHQEQASPRQHPQQLMASPSVDAAAATAAAVTAAKRKQPQTQVPAEASRDFASASAVGRNSPGLGILAKNKPLAKPRSQQITSPLRAPKRRPGSRASTPTPERSATPRVDDLDMPVLGGSSLQPFSTRPTGIIVHGTLTPALQAAMAAGMHTEQREYREPWTVAELDAHHLGPQSSPAGSSGTPHGNVAATRGSSSATGRVATSETSRAKRDSADLS